MEFSNEIYRLDNSLQISALDFVRTTRTVGTGARSTQVAMSVCGKQTGGSGPTGQSGCTEKDNNPRVIPFQ